MISNHAFVLAMKSLLWHRTLFNTNRIQRYDTSVLFLFGGFKGLCKFEPNLKQIHWLWAGVYLKIRLHEFISWRGQNFFDYVGQWPSFIIDWMCKSFFFHFRSIPYAACAFAWLCSRRRGSSRPSAVCGRSCSCYQVNHSCRGRSCRRTGGAPTAGVVTNTFSMFFPMFRGRYWRKISG